MQLNKKSLEVKKEHHYVYADYLRSWSNDSEVHYTTKKGKYAKDSVKAIAKERFFYKANHINTEQLKLITHFINLSNVDVLQEHHVNMLYNHCRFQYLTELYESSNKECSQVDALIKSAQYNG